MKKREIDVVGFIMGIVIGIIFGYLLGTRLHKENTEEVIKDNSKIYGNVYLLQIMKGNNLTEINNVLNDTSITYQIISDNGIYYVYAEIDIDETVLENKKEEYQTMGLNPIIKSQYILDWSEKYNADSQKYDFYNDAIGYFLDDLSGKEITIADEYYINPVDLEIFSNINLMKSIKNDEIKLAIQLETYKLLFEKLN